MALLKLAVRNLRRNRRRSTITLAALVIGVGVMVFLRGFINGQQEVILENIVKGRIGGVQVHRAGYIKNVLTSPLQLDLVDSPELRAKIAAVPHVIGVAPRIEFGAMLSTPDKRIAWDPQATPPADPRAARHYQWLADMMQKRRAQQAAMPEAAPTEEKTPEGESFSVEDTADGGTLVVEPGKTSFFMAIGIEPELEAKVTPRRHGLVDKGRMFPSADSPELVLNAEFAVGLEAAIHPPGAELPPVEQQVALLSGDRDGALNGENVVLGGTFPTFSPGDKRVGLVPLHVAQRLLRMEGHVTEYAVAIDSIRSADEVKKGVVAALGPEYEVHTWSELFPFINVMMSTQDFIFSIVSGVFLTVVLLGIVNAMLMTVLERTREIGTMLAVGMKRLQIIQLFMLEGVVIGAVGSFIGLAVGSLLVAYWNHRGIPLPAPGATVDSIVRPFVSSKFIIGMLVGTPLGAGLATLWPAWRASLLRPVEALQSA